MIVGGGGAGLTASMVLARQGVEHLLVSARPGGPICPLGIYGGAVQRSTYRDAKLRTMLDTIHEVLSATDPTPELLITDDTAHQHTSPLVVLVSNNAYALDQPEVAGSRPRLHAGQLGVIVLDRPGAERAPVVARSSPSPEITGAAAMPAGLDGEAITLLRRSGAQLVPARCASASHATTQAPALSPALVTRTAAVPQPAGNSIDPPSAERPTSSVVRLSRHRR